MSKYNFSDGLVPMTGVISYLTNTKDWYISDEMRIYFERRRLACENYGLNEWDFDDDY